MQFLTSWRDCLILFRPDNAKLFGLVTLNASMHAYHSIYHYFLPFLLTLIACVLYTNANWFLLPVIALLVYMLGVYLAARSSTLRKDLSYFLNYGIYLIWFSIFFITWLILLCGISLLGIPCWFRELPLYAPLFPFFSITIAFLCDTDGSFIEALLSVYRSFLFVFYNLPICVLLCSFFIAIAQLVFMIFPGPAVCLILGWPLVICTYINLYIKRVHEQFPLYFGKHE